MVSLWTERNWTLHGRRVNNAWLVQRIPAIPPYTKEVRRFYAAKLAKIKLLGLETSTIRRERTAAIREIRQCKAVLDSAFVDDNKDPTSI